MRGRMNVYVCVCAFYFILTPVLCTQHTYIHMYISHTCTYVLNNTNKKILNIRTGKTASWASRSSATRRSWSGSGRRYNRYTYLCV